MEVTKRLAREDGDGWRLGVAALRAAAALALCACAAPQSGDRQTALCVGPGETPQITGLGVIRGGPGPAPATAATPALSTLLRPEQVAAAPGFVVVADGGRGYLLRYQSAQQTLVPLARIGERTAGLFVDRFGTPFLALPASRRVIQLDAGGAIERTFQDPGRRSVPVDVAANEADRVFVADAANARVLIFNRLGEIVDSIGERGAARNPFASVDALAYANGALHVLDATARRVYRFGAPGGTSMLDFGEAVRLPVAIAADRWQRIFVADRSNGSVVMFDPSRTGPSPLRNLPAIGDLADIWLDDFGILHAADAAAGTVHLLQVPAPCE